MSSTPRNSPSTYHDPHYTRCPDCKKVHHRADSAHHNLVCPVRRRRLGGMVQSSTQTRVFPHRNILPMIQVQTDVIVQDSAIAPQIDSNPARVTTIRPQPVEPIQPDVGDTNQVDDRRGVGNLPSSTLTVTSNLASSTVRLSVSQNSRTPMTVVHSHSGHRTRAGMRSGAGSNSFQRPTDTGTNGSSSADRMVGTRHSEHRSSHIGSIPSVESGGYVASNSSNANIRGVGVGNGNAAFPSNGQSRNGQ
ncbi:uncharacterized protein FIBRA_07225 [Fibroporia radiculosa]|uniref:Uncharacterized protein n=1 Tax=Fibroporia radiculosa TaxID=599839 RepID=J4GUJ6_9APHY|nr:uncharacterized protein FIBRA_07225 [Fibroporia radiculosa]CCM05025.1 predicted protein [Fibroporia radiculosa]